MIQNYIGIQIPGIGGIPRKNIHSDLSEAKNANVRTGRFTIPEYAGKLDWDGQEWLFFCEEIKRALVAGIMPYWVMEISPNIRKSPNSCRILPQYEAGFQTYIIELLPRLKKLSPESRFIQGGNEWQAYATENLDSAVWYAENFYHNIKRADASFQVVLGASGDLQHFLLPILEQLSFQAFDIQDLHHYGTAFGDYRNLTDMVNEVRRVFHRRGWQVAIHSTENSAFSADAWNCIFQSEQMQAADNLKRVVHSLSLGIPVIIQAMGLKEWPLASPQGNQWPYDWSTYGLIFDGIGKGDRGDGMRKLGFYTFKMVSEKLTEAQFLSADQPASGIYRYRFAHPQRKVLDVVWYDRGIFGLPWKTVKLGAYPACRILDSITDFNGLRRATNCAAQPNLKVTLEEFLPVFIEG